MLESNLGKSDRATNVMFWVPLRGCIITHGAYIADTSITFIFDTTTDFESPEDSFYSPPLLLRKTMSFEL